MYKGEGNRKLPSPFLFTKFPEKEEVICWMVSQVCRSQKLLLGFVPTSDTEHMNCQRDYSCRNFYKNRYAIHDAIRPFHELGIKDRVYDYFFVLYCYLICLPGDE